MSTTDLTVSLDRDAGVVVEIEETESYCISAQHLTGLKVKFTYVPRRIALLGATLSPDEARAIATQLNEAADQFERDRLNEQQFPSNLGGVR